MSNKKISDLPVAGALTGPELLEVLQGGVNKKVTVTAMFSGAAFVDAEVPSGAVNDVNVTFTIALTPISGSVKVYHNGIRLKITEDYSISGTTITFVTAPATGDNILVDYRI